jgi:hypothetical protein
MLHSLRIYLSIPEVFFIFFEGGRSGGCEYAISFQISLAQGPGV